MPADYVNHAYCAGVENAGGIPILLPVLKDPADMDPVLAMCDGLLIPGGVDVDPRFYSEDPSPLLGSLDSAMDRFWIHAANYALEHKMPVLGICRGLQLVNVALVAVFIRIFPIRTRTICSIPRNRNAII